jgi:diguanylate cyclase (GGDEF)-like protein
VAEDSDVDHTLREGSDRHFSGLMTHYVIGYLRLLTDPRAPATVLERAGDTRTADDLCDDATWSSYTQLRSLLEATAAYIGSPERLRDLATESVAGMAEFASLVQSLGSPDELFRHMGDMSQHCAPILEMRTQQVGPSAWSVETEFNPGFEPFVEYCHFVVGLLASGPVSFGLPSAEVTHHLCVCRGDAECRFAVRWSDVGDVARAASYYEHRSEILEARLATLQRTVADLVSDGDLETVLTRIVRSAATAVSAPAYLLALEELPAASKRVYALGLNDLEAAVIAAELDSHRTPSAEERAAALHTGRLVVDVSSPQRHYGRLAAIHPYGRRFFEQETAILQAYARLAAAALDSASSLEHARRQGETARVLLELSSSLAEIVSVDEVAAKVVRAVPILVDCDRSAVVLIEPDSCTARFRAMWGYPLALDQELRSMSLAIERDDTGSPTAAKIASRYDGQFNAVSERAGSAATISVPIVGNGERLGWITASVTHRPARLSTHPELEVRLRGLAGQAAAAVQNARLLDQVRHQALHDSLTGLPNRTLVIDRIDQMLARCRRHPATPAALFLDLDGFKEVNDTLGHAAGDELLRLVSDRLARAMRQSDTFGRLGGDEFIVLTESEALDPDGPMLVARRLLDLMQRPFRLHGTTISLTASIGIAAGDRVSAGEMLRDADIALYRAKAAGKNRALVFRSEMHAAVQQHHELYGELRDALSRGEFFLAYQPIWNLRSGTTTGVEALLRWRHPTRGVVEPSLFIPLLEDSGLIVPVGAWVLEDACLHVGAVRRQGFDIHLAVNVSGRQLDDYGFVQTVEGILARTGFDPAALILEVTESVLMRDPEIAMKIFRTLRARGVRVAIDDFGTGYSSLAHLRSFPVDVLKIDRSFISGSEATSESEALAHMVVQLGKSLGLEIVAEGIEEHSQLRHLRAEDCDSGQGFLLARPLSPNGLLAHLHARPEIPFGEAPPVTSAVSAPGS